MDMQVFLQKERIFPVIHKIGAPISGPRIADRKFYGHEDFSENTTFKGWGAARGLEGFPHRKKKEIKDFSDFYFHILNSKVVHADYRLAGEINRSF